LNKRALVKEYAQKRRYFTLEEVVKVAGISNQLVKNYLLKLKQEGVIFSAANAQYYFCRGGEGRDSSCR